MVKPELSQLRAQALALYKTLLYYGRDYPMGYTYFRDRCHRAFEKNRDETDPLQIAKHLSRGDFIIKELEALYRLRKYRYLKHKYYPDKQEEETQQQQQQSIHSPPDVKQMMRQIEKAQKQ